MQVTLRHRQAAPGSFFVDCEVQFSEEEKSIIQHRGLGKHTIEVPSGIPHGSGVHPDAFIARMAVYPLTFCLIVGVVLLLIGIAEHQALPWAVFWLAIWIGGALYFRFAHQRHAASQKDQIIPLQRLLSNSVFTIAATDINEARYREDKVREVLKDMKQFLVGNAVVGNVALKEVETFEL
jgi:hypothetical protein